MPWRHVSAEPSVAIMVVHIQCSTFPWNPARVLPNFIKILSKTDDTLKCCLLFGNHKQHVNNNISFFRSLFRLPLVNNITLHTSQSAEFFLSYSLDMIISIDCDVCRVIDLCVAWRDKAVCPIIMSSQGSRFATMWSMDRLDTLLCIIPPTRRRSKILMQNINAIFVLVVDSVAIQGRRL